MFRGECSSLVAPYVEYSAPVVEGPHLRPLHRQQPARRVRHVPLRIGVPKAHLGVGTVILDPAFYAFTHAANWIARDASFEKSTTPSFRTASGSLASQSFGTNTMYSSKYSLSNSSVAGIKQPQLTW